MPAPCSQRIELGVTSMETSTLRKRTPASALLDPKIVLPAIGSAFVKLDPRTLFKNPVMFVLEVVTALTTIILIRDLVTGTGHIGFEFQIVLWLWFTVLFANFSEAIAEGRGKAQAESLRRQRTETQAKLLSGPDRRGFKNVPGTSLKVGDVVVVEAGATIPSPIGALPPACGSAGMDRLVRFNALATSGRAVEAAADVDTLLLDKTGTITLGNRQATEFRPLRGVTEQELADAAQLASLADETPEGRSIVVLAKEKYGMRGRELSELRGNFIPFTAQSRMSGMEVGASSVRKGAVDAILGFLNASDTVVVTSAVRALQPVVTVEAAREIDAIADEVAKSGGTPLAVAKDGRLLGVIHLKDIVKGGIRERFAELRRMGIRTVMITGDNPMTAAAIAAEAGVDDFLAQATPEDKLKLIRDEQAKGKLVAMCGDGTNDAPALAQADVGVAMNTGTVAAREAGNMVDLDSNPTKLIEVVEIGKQLLMTRGALTTFSIANDVAKYFAIIPAMFLAFYPQLAVLNVMHLASPQSAILSAIIFNALIIIALIPLALKGVAYRAVGAGALLRRNLLIYGLGGIIVPFIGIKAIDLVVAALHLA